MHIAQHQVTENKQNGVKDGSHSIKKLIDYLRLFAEVNRELIQDDEEKKWKGKKTRRYKISRQFIEVTESVEKILQLMQKLKVVSLSELRLQDSD